MSTANALKAAAGGQPAQPEGRTPYEQLKRQLEASKSEFMPLLGNSTQNVDRFVRVVLNAVLATPDLLDADRRSLIAACMRAAQDGLMPDGREAVLNIYNTKVKENGRDVWIKKAQYLPMVGGLVKKLYDSGEVTYIDAACVFANDRFTYRRGDEPKLEHEPTMQDDPGEIVAAYAVIKLKNGEVKREVMPKRDIEAVRNASKAKDSGPWVTWYDQQAIKSVIKRAYKQLPKADAFEKVIEADNQAIGFAATATGVADMISRGPAAMEYKPGETVPTTITQPESDPVPVEQKQEETKTKQDVRASMTFAQVADAMNRAKDTDTLDAAADLIRDVADDGQRGELQALYNDLRSKL